MTDRAAMLRYDETEHRAASSAMAKEIRRRSEAPDKAFIEHIRGDFTRIFDRVLADRDAESPTRG